MALTLDPVPMSTTSFGRALADARRRRHLRQRQLGHAIGVRQSAITQWERGLVIPRNEHVLAAEQALTLPPGSLACLLGFGPPTDRPPPAPPQPAVAEAIAADEDLDDQQRQLLLGLYRSFTEAPAPQHRSTGPA